MTTATDRQVSVFGIRHHGPGSARSLLRALEELRPDCILIEGPEDATHLIPLAAHASMKPPVALLVYDPDEPRRCAFYPFAEFSPEWQAMRFAVAREIPVRFMDLPQRHLLAIEKRREEAEAANQPEEAEGETDLEVSAIDDAEAVEWHRDPLGLLARAAGFDDTERWWEVLVEQRVDGSGVFDAVAEAMGAVRAEIGDAPSHEAERERLREAFMRSTIREAQKEGFARIAVVCGAWHAPALAKMPPAKEDNAILKGLPKTKVEATWAPWTYARLASASGYGAGVASPGWYDFLWNSAADDASRLSTRWLARVASVLRGRDFDVSSAHLIEAVRLIDALCAMRGIPLPGLDELNEAIVGVLLFGDATPLALVHRGLIVGEAMGEVPAEAPTVPLHADLERQQKRLRLKPTADHKDIDLDLRAENDLERSRLLHRLRILDIPWGDFAGGGGRGTFREKWRLQWQPELVVAVVAAAIYGNTVESAAANRTASRAREAQRLAEVTELVEVALLADLHAAIPVAMQRLEAMAAVASDVSQIMDAVPALAQASRYGNVRGTDVGSVAHVLETMVVRACVGLGGACASLDDDAASAIAKRLSAVDAAVVLVENPELRATWRKALAVLLGGQGTHGNVVGRTCRLLLDGGDIDADEAARHFGLALSRGTDPARGGWWIEGFLGGSGMLLLHTDSLWNIVDGWVCSLSEEAFVDVLPLLRRTFATFAAPERRMMGERVKRGDASSAPRAVAPRGDDIDAARADTVLPLLALILAREAAP